MDKIVKRKIVKASKEDHHFVRADNGWILLAKLKSPHPVLGKVDSVKTSLVVEVRTKNTIYKLV